MISASILRASVTVKEAGLPDRSLDFFHEERNFLISWLLCSRHRADTRRNSAPEGMWSVCSLFILSLETICKMSVSTPRAFSVCNASRFNHTACRFAGKTRFFHPLLAGRRCAAASRFIFFKGKTLSPAAKEKHAPHLELFASGHTITIMAPCRPYRRGSACRKP